MYREKCNMPNTIKITKKTEDWYHKQFLLSFFTPEVLATIPKAQLKKMAKKTLKTIKSLAPHKVKGE